jgi:hypothetical protein
VKKIISLFKRDYEGNRQVYDELVEGAEWVANGEGTPTRKYDGTCCMIKDGSLWRRYDVKKGRTQPSGFVAAMEPDPVTGHHCGWIPCDRSNKQDKYHYEAFDALGITVFDGTYELCGPKVQKNPEKFDSHVLVAHGTDTLPDAPRTFDALKEWFAGKDIEGIVWHHSDGRMVKIKAKDFGLKRKGKSCE